MADKKITDLTLRSNVNDDVNFPGDDTIQTYRVTAPQIAQYALAKPRAIVYKSANYLAAAADHVISCDASGGTFTVSLPTAVGIEGKIYLVKRTDTDMSKDVIIDGHSSETIDGSTTLTLKIGDCYTIISDNSNWQVLHRYSKPCNSSVRVNSCGGNASTNNYIPYWTSVQDNIGSAITYNSDSSLGDSFVINEDGMYDIYYETSGQAPGITKNESGFFTSNINGVTQSMILAAMNTSSGDLIAVSVFLQRGDVIR